MSRLLVPFGALIAIAVPQSVPAPVRASASLAPVPAKQQPENEAANTDGLFSDYIDQLYRRRFDDALATVGQLSPDKSNREGMAIVSAMRAGALLGLKKDKEALRLFRQADSDAPLVDFISVVQFLSGTVSNKPLVALEALDRMIARFPDTVRDLDPEAVTYALQNEPKNERKRNDDRMVSLAQIGFGGDEGDYLTEHAIEILLKRGDVAGAVDLLQYIDEPPVVADLLVRKRFAALWPRIEAIAGPHLQNVRNSVAEKAEKAYADDPTDSRRLNLLIDALRHARRFDAAIALRSKLPATSEAMASADLQMGWAVNYVALALHSADRPAEADQLFALLNDAPMRGGRWRVNMRINRLELLVGDAKFAQALSLLDATEASARDGGNDYARQLVRRLKYCVLSGLGRADEAARLLPEVMKYADNAPAATIDGLVCAGRLDEAEKFALASLANEDFESSFVGQLQRDPRPSDDPSVWSKGWQALRQRPAIAREFERLGRDLPEKFLLSNPK